MPNLETADLNSIIQSAAKGESCPAGDLTDLHLHTCLKQLYSDYNDGKMQLDECKRQKEMLVAAWQSDKDTWERYRKATKDWNSKIKQAETTGKQLHKAETLRQFAQDAAIVIECVCGEVGLVKKVSELQ